MKKKKKKTEPFVTSAGHTWDEHVHPSEKERPKCIRCGIATDSKEVLRQCKQEVVSKLTPDPLP
jgi:hypothetical protein